MKEHRQRLVRALAVLFLVNILVILFFQTAQATTYRLGSSGGEVQTIQTKLQRWGYYNGAVDGIYGSKTAEAVRYFQQKNGLVVDGIVGPATLSALGMTSGGGNAVSAAQSESVSLLARVISAEARGEPYSGQVAVGAVILNRVSHPAFPNTIAGVVYQPGAFTCMVDGQFQQPVSDSAVRAAQEAMAGADPSGGAIYYFNPDTATSAWIWSRPLIKTIGKHRFCA
ncbi:MAG: spore cortex-lytic enzyme [Oscillospiraceae bacterium]|nr:spore cortex-lytic enzyme [Oscillospiraceae bacterium]